MLTAPTLYGNPSTSPFAPRKSSSRGVAPTEPRSVLRGLQDGYGRAASLSCRPGGSLTAGQMPEPSQGRRSVKGRGLIGQKLSRRAPPAAPPGVPAKSWRLGSTEAGAAGARGASSPALSPADEASHSRGREVPIQAGLGPGRPPGPPGRILTTWQKSHSPGKGHGSSLGARKEDAKGC